MSEGSMFQQILDAFVFAAFMMLVIMIATKLVMHYRKRNFSWKVFLNEHKYFLLFCFYYLMVLRITCFGRTHFQGINLRLFSSYEDAWFGFSENAWQQLILNIVMFVPLGMIIPLLKPRFQNIVWALGIVFASTLFIEGIQYVFHLGVFEYDDLFNNTLGGMLGFCVVMVVLNKRHILHAVAYGLLPLAVFIASIAAVVCYTQKPYGNLSAGSFSSYDWGSTSVRFDGKLSDKQVDFPLYQQQTVSDDVLQNQLDKLKAILDLDKNPMINENSSNGVYDYENGRVMVNKKTGSWQYIGNVEITTEVTDVEQAEKAAMEYVNKLSLLDSYAKRVNIKDDSGTLQWNWQLDGRRDGKEGSLSVTCNDSGELVSLDYDVTSYKYVKTIQVISPKQAFERLKDGKFRTWY